MALQLIQELQLKLEEILRGRKFFVLANLEASLLREFMFLPGRPQSNRETDFNWTQPSRTATLEDWSQENFSKTW